MSIEANPYQPPTDLDSERRPEHEGWTFVFWAGTASMFIGTVSSFTANMPPLGWLIISAVLMTTVAIGSKRNRKRGCIVLVSTLLLGANAIYQHQSLLNAIEAEQSMIADIEAVAAYEEAMEAAMEEDYEAAMDVGE